MMNTRSVASLAAAGRTDPGRLRAVNEDRLHVDATRGLFVVIDGVGGQAAGGKAADVALSMVKTRLERGTGPVEARIREAFTNANNEIHRLAGTRPEWHGMACVATVLILDGSRAVAGHVGDTRLYRLSPGGIEKVTHDHSPVGEREDAGEISEFEAMRHSRRNEVYRDLGTDAHEPGDPEFIEVVEARFADDTAFLLCSDGLTDLIDSAAIDDLVTRFAGEPDRVASALVDAANRAGGRDNVTVVYVEGDRFASMRRAAPAALPPRPPARGRTSIAGQSGLPPSPRPPEIVKPSKAEKGVRAALLALLTMLLAVSVGTLPRPAVPAPDAVAPPLLSQSHQGQLVVRAGESISQALERATPGIEVVVEPGEYREAISLASHVRLVSRVPGGAILRLPANARETDAAAIARNVSGAAITGFRIVGDAATALGTGVLIQDSEVSIVDTDISGATGVAIDVAGASRVDIMATDVHDNPGAALAVRAGASARVTHNVFRRNAASPAVPAAVILEEAIELRLAANMFQDVTPQAFHALSGAARAALTRDNWFVETRSPRALPPARSHGGQAPRTGPIAQPRQTGQP
jgi:serine/threonine protein phosphatase PrpC